ncbi:protein argonaute [Trifolium repens]|nr:protein argonaute [Trifolium repens]
MTEICVLLLINFTFDENVIEYEPTFPLSAFIEPLSLIDIVAQILRKDVYSKPITDADRVKIKKALKGVKVEVTYRGRFRRKYRKTGVTSQPTRELLYVIVIFSVNFTFYIFVL